MEERKEDICMYVFIQTISIAPLQVHFYQKRSRHSTDTVPEFHAEALWATANKGLAQGPNVAARAGFEPTILRLNQCATTSHVYV